MCALGVGWVGFLCLSILVLWTVKVNSTVFDLQIHSYFCPSLNHVIISTTDRLAALWPFIGIMCEVIILIAIIFIHEKCTQGGDVGEDDDDDEAMEP